LPFPSPLPARMMAGLSAFGGQALSPNGAGSIDPIISLFMSSSIRICLGSQLQFSMAPEKTFAILNILF